MGFFDNLKKEVKKTYDKVTNYVEEKAAVAGTGLKEVTSGDFKKGLGDLGELGATTGFDVATAGNTDLVDQASGGAITRAKSAARGNTKDIVSTAIAGGAAYAGGVGAGVSASNIINSKGISTQSIAEIALKTAAPNVGGLGGEILTKASTFFNQPKPFSDGKAVEVEDSYFSTKSGYEENKQATNPLPLVAGLTATLLLIALAKKG